MTAPQREAVWRLLVSMAPQEAHHGDCVGADEEFAELARRAGARVIAHPPRDERLRAHAYADETREPDDFLARDRAIVAETEVVVAAPRQETEPAKTPRGSGTWYTAKYARRAGRTQITVFPDGRVEVPAVKGTKALGASGR